MWETREKAIDALKTKLHPEASLICEGFELIEDIIQSFNDMPNPTNFSRVCMVVLIKARNLSQGIFSLALDGLAQESGALLRPLIECFELLQYLYEDPKRVEEAINGKLPQAGDIAKKINGGNKDLREHLNRYASHFSLHIESLKHVVNLRDGSIKVKQPYTENVLKTNLSFLFLFLVQLSFPAANCLNICGRSLPDSIRDRLELWRDKGLRDVKITFKNHI